MNVAMFIVHSYVAVRYLWLLSVNRVHSKSLERQSISKGEFVEADGNKE